MSISNEQLAAELAAIMTKQSKDFFIHLMNTGNVESAKKCIKRNTEKHITEQIIIGSHASTAPAMQEGLIELAYMLLRNNTKFEINKYGEVVEVAL